MWATQTASNTVVECNPDSWDCWNTVHPFPPSLFLERDRLSTLWERSDVSLRECCHQTVLLSLYICTCVCVPSYMGYNVRGSGSGLNLGVGLLLSNHLFFISKFINCNFLCVFTMEATSHGGRSELKQTLATSRWMLHCISIFSSVAI